MSEIQMRGSEWPNRAREDGSCCGMAEEIKVAKRRDQPQPWILRKALVAVTLGILGYASYVYIGRLCLGMILKRKDALAGRNTGVALLVVYCVLILWTLWAYTKAVLTSPGYAKDHVNQEPQPFIAISTVPSEQRVFPGDLNGRGSFSIGRADSIGGPSYEDMRASEDFSGASTSRNELAPPMEEAFAQRRDNTTATPSTVNALTSPEVGKARESTIEEDYVPGIPSRYPALDPANRYCSKDGFVKPYRAHHCRACGTCVLKYDHHCPWIGQCVGARNHKFFVNCIQAASVFTLYVFATTMAYTIKDGIGGPDKDIDPQFIVLIALAAIFALFTTLLLFTHIKLIWQGQTTVENLRIRVFKEREERKLYKAYGFCGYKMKARKRREWNDEWGRMSTEGNMWWLGSGWQNWRDVMGKGVCGWFLPIGRSLSDGLSYPVNPRFNALGILQRRANWPEALR